MSYMILIWVLFNHGHGECRAAMVCTGDDQCEATVLTETCTQPWTLETCLKSGAEVPGGDAADILGCDPFARVIDVDYTGAEYREYREYMEALEQEHMADCGY